MGVSKERIYDCILEICKVADPESPYFGMLLNKRIDGWEYGIGLSNRHVFHTSPDNFKIHSIRELKPKTVLCIDHLTYPPNKTIERLIHALLYFGHWHHSTHGWNSEHLGRLIATNESISYEVRKQRRSVRAKYHNGLHLTAKLNFLNYLKQNAPHLAVRTLYSPSKDPLVPTLDDASTLDSPSISNAPAIGGDRSNLAPVIGGFATIKSALKSPDFQVRVRALTDLAAFGEPARRVLLLTYLSDPSFQVKGFAWTKLLGTPKTYHQLSVIPCPSSPSLIS